MCKVTLLPSFSEVSSCLGVAAIVMLLSSVGQSLSDRPECCGDSVAVTFLPPCLMTVLYSGSCGDSVICGLVGTGFLT